MPAPLAPLESGKTRFGDEQYRYPIDIGNNSKHSHIVQFTIYDPKEISFTASPQGGNGGGGDGGGGNFLSGAAGDAFNNAFSGLGLNSDIVNSTLTNIGKGVQDILKGGYNATSGYTQTNAGITLYMPDSLDFSSSADYNSINLTDLIASVGQKVMEKIPGMGTIAGALGNVLRGEGAEGRLGQFGLNAAGFAINPQQQLLFQGIDFRSFAMAFVFTAKSSSESAMIQSIVKAFKKAAAPTLVEGTAGFIYRPPSLFEITFLSGGSTNRYLHKLGKSVLKEVQVNYAPNGWSAYENGAPVQVTLALQFQEVELMHRAKIDEGY
jgi:hypothetical protein